MSMNKKSYYRITDHATLRKDPKVGSILLADKGVADDYTTRKMQYDEVDSLKKDLASVKDTMQEILLLLQKDRKDQ